MTTPSPNTSPPNPSRPPPLPTTNPQSLSYFVPPPPVGWAVVGAFSASDWHSARRLLAKRDIVARMGKSTDDTGQSIEMLVPASQESYARSLLAGVTDSVPELEQKTRRLPVVITHAPPSTDSPVPVANPVRPLPVAPLPVRPRLSRLQIWAYNIIIVLCVLVLIGTLGLLAAFLLSS
jgi:hypothetical protein